MGDEAFLEMVRRIALYTNDALWTEHLEQMDYLRSSVNLRAYGQREPIVEYKKEGLAMFKGMEETFKEQVYSMISSINTDNVVNLQPENNAAKEIFIESQSEQKSNPSNTDPKKDIGRNDPCWCGSGKKFKKCHGR